MRHPRYPALALVEDLARMAAVERRLANRAKDLELRAEYRGRAQGYENAREMLRGIGRERWREGPE